MSLPFEDPEVPVVADCSYCHELLFADDTVLYYDTEYFCGEHCLMEHIGVEKTEGYELLK